MDEKNLGRRLSHLHRTELFGHGDLTESMVGANERHCRRRALREEERTGELHGIISSERVPFDELARQIRRRASHLDDNYFREIGNDLLGEILRSRLGQIAFACPSPEGRWDLDARNGGRCHSPTEEGANCIAPFFLDVALHERAGVQEVDQRRSSSSVSARGRPRTGAGRARARVFFP